MKFKPEDFCTSSYTDKCDHGGLKDYDCNAQFNAARANARLEQMLAEAPVVYGMPDPSVQDYTAWDRIRLRDDTHTARLVDIKEIK